MAPMASWLSRIFRRTVAAPALALEAAHTDEAPRRRTDGFIDPNAGHGTERDPRWWLSYQADLLTEEQGIEMVRGSWLANKVVSGIVEEAFRPGWALEVAERSTLRGTNGELAGEDKIAAEAHQQATLAEWKRLGLLDKLMTALEWERREGGAAIMLGLNDRQTKPDAKARPNAKLEWMRVVRARDLTPARYYTDHSADKYGEVELWNYTPTGRNGATGPSPMLLVHESRLIIFGGRRVSDDVLPGQWPGFGDGELMLVVAAIRRFAMALDGMELTARRNGEPWWQIEGLAELLAADGQKEFNGLLAAMERARSQLKVRVVDGKDKFGITAAPLEGYVGIVAALKDECAAAADTPKSILFGDLPGGIGDGSKGPREDWNAKVEAWATRHVIPRLTRLTELIMLGAGGQPSEWVVKQLPLAQASAAEKAEETDLEAKTDIAMVGAGIITASEVRARKIWRDRYQLEIDADGLEVGDVPDDIRDPGAAAEGDAPAPVDGAPGAAPAGGPVQAIALNGAQMAGLLGIVRAVTAGEIPREAAIELVLASIPSLPRDQAVRMIGPEGFEAAKPVPPAFGAPPPDSAKPEEPAP